MHDQPDRSARHDDGFVRASSHPELVGGDLFISPRASSLASVHSGVSSRWVLAMSAIALAGVVGAMTMGEEADVPEQRADRAVASECQSWRDEARRAVAGIALHGGDADLHQIGDVVFRMRRASRNCQAGWLTLACQDYRAVVTMAASRVSIPLGMPQCKDPALRSTALEGVTTGRAP